jgi:lysophospholipase L1-like esterase
MRFILFLMTCCAAWGQALSINDSALLSQQLSGWNFLYYDGFTTDENSPMTSPRTATPGPGTATIIANDGTFSNYNGACFVGQQVSAAAGDLRITGGSFARVPGRTVIGFLRYTNSSSTFRFGWDNNTTNEVDSAAIMSESSVGTVRMNGSGPYWMWLMPYNCTYELAVVLQSVGSFMLIKGGNIYKDWTLAWVDRTSSATNLYPASEWHSTGGWISSMKVVDLPAPWDTTNGIASGFVASPAANETLTMNTNAFIEAKWQLVNGTTQFLNFRYTDDNNRWYVDVCATASGSSAATNIRLVEVTNGTAVVRATSSGNMSTLTQRRFWVRCHWTDIRAGVDNTRYFNYTGTMQNTGALAKVSAAGSDFTVFPLAVPFPQDLSPSLKGCLAIGDSKTAGTADMDNTLRGWVPIFDRIANVDSFVYGELPVRIATAGDTTAMVRGHIDADLTTRFESPTYALVNLGANDVPSMPSESIWFSNMWYIVSAVKTKWPSTQFYFMRPWKRGYDSQCDTMAGWYSTLCASNTSYCFLGPDERVFLKSSDNGTNYTTDGTHPNSAGYLLTAQKWKETIAP